MSKVTIRARLDFVLEMIGDIESYQQELVSIETMMNKTMCFNAVLMNILQIGETLSKLDKALLEKYDLIQEAKGAASVRNFIAHDYSSVNKATIEAIVRNYLPSLKEKIAKILKESSFLLESV